MSEIFQKMNDMIKNNQLPDNIKSMMESFASNSSSHQDVSSSNRNRTKVNDTSDCNNFNSNSSTAGSDTANNSNFSDNSNSENSDTSNTSFPDFDIDTMLKMKSIIDSMNKPQNDPRANLLKSLKPYLKSSRKDKVDQYIKLFSMGKVFEAMNPLGGEKKNDV